MHSLREFLHKLLEWIPTAKQGSQGMRGHGNQYRWFDGSSRFRDDLPGGPQLLEEIGQERADLRNSPVFVQQDELAQTAVVNRRSTAVIEVQPPSSTLVTVTVRRRIQYRSPAAKAGHIDPDDGVGTCRTKRAALLRKSRCASTAQTRKHEIEDVTYEAISHSSTGLVKICEA